MWIIISIFSLQILILKSRREKSHIIAAFGEPGPICKTSRIYQPCNLFNCFSVALLILTQVPARVNLGLCLMPGLWRCCRRAEGRPPCEHGAAVEERLLSLWEKWSRLKKSGLQRGAAAKNLRCGGLHFVFGNCLSTRGLWRQPTSKERLGVLVQTRKP